MAKLANPIVRVLRVIEYIGERDWVDNCITKRQLKVSYTCDRGSISEAILGDTREILEKASEQFCESRSQNKEDNK